MEALMEKGNQLVLMKFSFEKQDITRLPLSGICGLFEFPLQKEFFSNALDITRIKLSIEALL